MKCKICKKKIENTKYKPKINKVEYTLCSQRCFSIYLNCWKDEKNFPENLNNINVPQEIEEFPDY